MVKIVMDSSGDLTSLPGVDFSAVPLKIAAGGREFVDDATLDVEEMVEYLRGCKSKSSTACPGVGEYLNAFGDADDVYCITITSNLSGSYNAAAIAAQTYLEQHPQRKVHVFDTLSAGPEMALLAEKVAALVQLGKSFREIVEAGCAYLQKTRLLFSLESLHNLAVNGRVPGAVAKVVGVLGIRLLGQASEDGRLQPNGKARGERRVVPELMKKLADLGYKGGKVRISHCMNPSAAEELKTAILGLFPAADVLYRKAGALCSFYAEAGGLLVGFET